MRLRLSFAGREGRANAPLTPRHRRVLVTTKFQFRTHDTALPPHVRLLEARLTHGGVDVCLENLRFVELLVPVGRDPDLAQRALLREDDLTIEHAAYVRTKTASAELTPAEHSLPPPPLP